MENKVKFAIDDIQIVQSDNYSEEEFAIAKVGFLGSNPNSHELNISNEVLLADASSVLGKFLVAEINEYTKDATTHSPKEIIHGYFPKEQNVEFREIEDGYIRAYADAVVSKIYAKDLCNIFERGDKRSVSVEMQIVTEHDLPTQDKVISFNIVGVTVLGAGVRPSSPMSDMEFVRFSEDYFKAYSDKNSDLQKFAKERRKLMSEYVNHPIDTSKAAVYDGDWDGDKAKHDLIKEEKFTSLAPKVCLRLEDGWRDREVSKLGYPVMCLHEGKWVYSRKGLASALAYAKQHEDNEIVNKVEALYKKLGLDSDGKEESAKMNELENFEEQTQEMTECEDTQKEDTAMGENCPDCGKPVSECECEHIDEHDDAHDGEDAHEQECDCAEETEAKMSEEEMSARIGELESEIEKRDNIIMEKDAELEDLRKFKADRLEQDKAMTVSSVLNSMEDYLEKEAIATYRAEGLSCEFADLDAWTNKVKASIVDRALKKGKKNSADFMRISAPVDNDKNSSDNVWDRIKNKH